MSELSRRSLLGYSGTAAAGAVLASSGTAQATAAEATEATATAVTFPDGTKFSGTVMMEPSDSGPQISLSFSVGFSSTPTANTITPLEIANALNELTASRGWPAITFYGTPAPAPLT
ncbi:hypothetical protein ACFVYG_18680 [Streptomyces sp. NPDC058256]|uniref:hypothetical protein n=1 Tax=Streptomyces sp. NPDC058256 TaxID=3346408 RepID=UPI0036E2A8F3